MLKMKNILFHKVVTKATALVVSSLMVFAGQAFAISSSEKEVSNANRLGNSKLIVAQDASTPIPEPEKVKLNQIVAQVTTVLGDALAQARAVATSVKDPETKQAATAIDQLLSRAVTTIGNAASIGDADAFANSLSEVETIIGDALVIAQSIASSPEGNALAAAVRQAATTVGNVLYPGRCSIASC